MSPIRKRMLALVLGVSALVPTVAATPAQAARHVLIYAGACPISVVFHMHAPIGFTTLGNPGYDIEVHEIGGCVLSDTPPDVLRTTTVSASGNSSLFNCSSVVGFGYWNQSWRKGNGINSPQPVNGGIHRIYGTYGNWVLETEGPSVAQFAGVAHLTIDPLWAGQMAAACSNGSLWELRMTGVQAFEDPQP